MTPRFNLLRTSTFKLAAVYLLVFALSSGAMLAYVFYNTAGLLERQSEDTIRAEVQALADQYRIRGLRGVVDIIQRRISDNTGTIYFLAGEDGQRIVGNLVELPARNLEHGVWIDFPITVGRGPQALRHTARAYHVNLSGGFELLVGRDVEEQRAFRSLIQNALLWALGLMIVLGVGGGWLTSRNFLRRVEAINGATRTIMAGDLSQRMPIKGSGDELDRLSQSLNEMLGQIERLMAGMKEVSSNVAHDLKTPLTRLRARAEAALRASSAQEHRLALQQTITESDQLLQTFNALLSIARAEAGQAREGLAPVLIGDILQDVVELYEPMIEDTGGTLAFSPPEKLTVRADRQLLAQLFSNLIDNAMKYGVDVATGKLALSIAAVADGQTARITVSDTGRGIPEKDRARVFERFVRLDESRSKPGNGLGLSLVAGVVKLHGGAIRFEDANPGLKAIVELPLLAEGR